MPVLDNAEGVGDYRREDPERWSAIAVLLAHDAAREHPDLWADTGIPKSLADLDVPVESLWAAVQLALSGADHDVLADTLGSPTRQRGGSSSSPPNNSSPRTHRPRGPD
ncbi:MAG: hypothetical protein J2P19_25060 [Pseudonocardia sp.]|nr:hypothetical protein [Pseudonocardia sp.]